MTTTYTSQQLNGILPLVQDLVSQKSPANSYLAPSYEGDSAAIEDRMKQYNAYSPSNLGGLTNYFKDLAPASSSSYVFMTPDQFKAASDNLTGMSVPDSQSLAALMGELKPLGTNKYGTFYDRGALTNQLSNYGAVANDQYDQLLKFAPELANLQALASTSSGKYYDKTAFDAATAPYREGMNTYHTLFDQFLPGGAHSYSGVQYGRDAFIPFMERALRPGVSADSGPTTTTRVEYDEYGQPHTVVEEVPRQDPEWELRAAWKGAEEGNNASAYAEATPWYGDFKKWYNTFGTHLGDQDAYDYLAAAPSAVGMAFARSQNPLDWASSLGSKDSNYHIPLTGSAASLLNRSSAEYSAMMDGGNGKGFLGGLIHAVDLFHDKIDPFDAAIQKLVLGSQANQEKFIGTLGPMVLDYFVPGLGSALNSANAASAGNWGGAIAGALGSYLGATGGFESMGNTLSGGSLTGSQASMLGKGVYGLGSTALQGGDLGQALASGALGALSAYGGSAINSSGLDSMGQLAARAALGLGSTTASNALRGRKPSLGQLAGVGLGLLPGKA